MVGTYLYSHLTPVSDHTGPTAETPVLKAFTTLTFHKEKLPISCGKRSYGYHIQVYSKCCCLLQEALKEVTGHQKD